jgi:hypothetical protein
LGIDDWGLGIADCRLGIEDWGLTIGDWGLECRVRGNGNAFPLQFVNASTRLNSFATHSQLVPKHNLGTRKRDPILRNEGDLIYKCFVFLQIARISAYEVTGNGIVWKESREKGGQRGMSA